MKVAVLLVLVLLLKLLSNQYEVVLDTALTTQRSILVFKYRPIAQLVEYRSPKPRVGGSRPSWPAMNLVNFKS